jgi:hypothetical protein
VAALHRADRRRKPSTVAGYQVIVRSQLLPAFGELPLEEITPTLIERWLAEACCELWVGRRDGPEPGLG